MRWAGHVSGTKSMHQMQEVIAIQAPEDNMKVNRE
jgi:hypothetical protein